MHKTDLTKPVENGLYRMYATVVHKGYASYYGIRLKSNTVLDLPKDRAELMAKTGKMSTEENLTSAQRQHFSLPPVQAAEPLPEKAQEPEKQPKPKRGRRKKPTTS